MKFVNQILLIVLFILGYIYINIRQLIPVNFFHETSSLYFFSALLQSNAAIFSIVGVFIVFKLQSMQTPIDLLKNSLMQDRGRIIQPITVSRFDKKSLKEKDDYVNFMKDDQQLKYYLQNWVDQENKIDRVKSAIKSPAITITIVMILNILGLIFSNYIHSKNIYLELFILSIFVIIQIELLLLLVKSISQLLDIKK